MLYYNGIFYQGETKFSSHMSKYRQFLIKKYDSLELISIDEQLDCSSSKYVSLTLEKANDKVEATAKRDRQLRQGDEVMLSEALNVGKEKNKVILIKGNPGMGKSTLAINMCKCWAVGSLLQSYKAVILLTLRDPEIQAAKTIIDLLLIPNEELSECVVKEITGNFGNQICFILEGYDELPKRLHKSSVFTKIKEKLPDCTLIYTSRPEACSKIEKVATRIITIQGFKKESINQYISNTFDNIMDGEMLAMQLSTQLTKSYNWTVRQILHIPINIAIVCLIFFHFSKLPETLTELYTLLCLRLIFRHIITRTSNEAQVEKLSSLDNLPKDISEQFSQLCYIAYHGIRNEMVIFSSQELMDIGINVSKISDLGLLVIAPSTSVYGREKSYNFIHKTLQEFCAAWHISKMPQPEQLFDVDFYWNMAYYEIVRQFYSGITGLNNKEVLNCILPEKQLKSYITELKTSRLMSCVYEAHNNEVCQLVGDYFDGNIHCKSSPNLAYFLTSYKGPIKIMHVEYLSDGPCQAIAESLQIRKSQNRADNLILQIPYCSVSHRAFTLLMKPLAMQYPIVELHMSGIKLKSEDSFTISTDCLFDVQILFQVLTSSTTLRVLDISCTDIHFDEAAAVCFANLRNISLCDLRMSMCKLGPAGANIIGEMLYHNKSITSIDISYNGIEDIGVERFVYHLTKNKTNLQNLKLSGNLITAVGAEHLKKLIKFTYSALSSIDLSNNPLEDKGVHLILASLTVTMEYIGLKLIHSEVASSSHSVIAAALHKTKSISLELPEGCENICDSLVHTTELQHLDLYINNDSANHKVLSAIKQNDVIKTLKLDYFHFENWMADVNMLLEFTKTLTQLTIKTFKGPVDLSQMAKAFTVNSSVKIFQYYNPYGCMTVGGA